MKHSAALGAALVPASAGLLAQKTSYDRNSHKSLRISQ
jgi:hypothetical protein